MATNSLASRKQNLVQDELESLELLREMQNEEYNRGLHSFFSSFWKGCLNSLRVANKHPRVWLWSLITFCILCGVALPLIASKATDQDIAEHKAALHLANETGVWFSDQLNQAVLPLFSLAQFVSEIDEFFNLADRVGLVGTQDSLPVLPGTPPTHRNVSGVCNDPVVLNRFNEIAQTIKENANMEGVLVTLQLVPFEVVCMVYPLVNEEDFVDGAYLNSTGAIGLDLLTDPNRVIFAESVIKSDGVYIAGPLTLRQCQIEGDCEATVEKAFVAALPVGSTEHQIAVDGKSYSVWGSVEALINWQALVERSGVFERFDEQSKGFQLTREDKVVDPETGEEYTKLVVLAETDDFHSDKYTKLASTALDTTDDLWQMSIVYTNSDWLGWAMAVAIVLSFIVATLIFMMLVEKHQLGDVKRRYFKDVAQPQKLRLRLFLDDRLEEARTRTTELLNQRPIADFYPATTILFANISGFESFASEREPSQVFKLLQTVFFHFDKVALKRQVFKVDTLGDTYMAVTGLPDSQPDHAIRMVKYAQECLIAFDYLTRELEKDLGPATGALMLRIGISSGPTTAGVLLGQSHSRLHLFGCTVDLAAKMGESAEAGRIQLSQNTADMLVRAGKRKWIEPRTKAGDDKLIAGVQSYHITERKSTGHIPKQHHDSDIETTGYDASFCSDLSARSVGLWEEEDSDRVLLLAESMNDASAKKRRLVEWQAQSLIRLLKPIVAFQDSKIKKTNPVQLSGNSSILEEVKEVINLPDFDRTRHSRLRDCQSLNLGKKIEEQVHSLVRQISCLYRDNPFHNFEHACHVTMAVQKLLDRIVTPEDVDYQRRSSNKLASDLHNYTFGITSDPLTHFAVVFSALIHDIGHSGVGNEQLAKESPALAEKYRHQSIAEQHSVDVGWQALMQAEFKELQQSLFPTPEEYKRFRQLVVNSVIATDVFDRELVALRNTRWERAFHGYEPTGVDSSHSLLDTSTHVTRSSVSSTRSIGKSLASPPKNRVATKEIKLEATNRKATIVIEHIIQASDVSHTMQHWTVYRKWNERLFQEMILAWKQGRHAHNPIDTWYKGELWFFDNYVIPLSRKLDECGVFGVASDECLFNATENRRLWELEGLEIVQQMADRIRGE